MFSMESLKSSSKHRLNNNLISQQNSLNKKVEEANLTLSDFETAKRKLEIGNSNFLRQLQEHQNSASMLNKYKLQLQTQLEDAKLSSDRILPFSDWNILSILKISKGFTDWIEMLSDVYYILRYF